MNYCMMVKFIKINQLIYNLNNNNNNNLYFSFVNGQIALIGSLPAYDVTTHIGSPENDPPLDHLLEGSSAFRCSPQTSCSWWEGSRRSAGMALQSSRAR